MISRRLAACNATGILFILSLATSVGLIAIAVGLSALSVAIASPVIASLRDATLLTAGLCVLSTSVMMVAHFFMLRRLGEEGAVR